MGETPRETVSRVYEEFEKYWNSLEDETPRGAAILAMCRLELILDKAFRILAPDIKFQIKTTEVRLYVGIVAGLYDKKVFDGLKIINKIRNKFAHRADVKDFDHEDVSSRCENLKNCIPCKIPFGDFCKAKTNRERYLACIREASRDISDSVNEKTGHRIEWHTEGVF